ncbi:MAG: hypothetical protein KC478_04095 [Bacteriovoracaceae bacterium]|nr:hypothetical protein [Bacteriovoracaceae bacterium]
MKYFSLVFLLSCFYINDSKAKGPLECLSAREYITSFEYLRSNKEFGFKQSQMRKFANEVSKGCSGASSRFIKVAKLLTGVGIDSSEALNGALKFVNSKDEVVDVFVKIFKKVYEEDFLDLDASTAMKTSVRLSAQFNGDPKKGGKDFETIAHFCKSSDGLGLSLKDCAKLSMDVTVAGEKFNKRVSKVFIQLFKFLSDDSDGPRLDISSSLKIAKELVAFGPLTFKNFKTAFEYGISEKGLGLPKKQALTLARTLASRSSLEVPSNL